MFLLRCSFDKQKTNQQKQNIVFWINQKGFFNPADCLSKFDLDKDSASKWMELANRILRPNWIQSHPKFYLHKLLKESSEKIRDLRNGGYRPPNSEEAALSHQCTETKEGPDVIANYIEVTEKI